MVCVKFSYFLFLYVEFEYVATAYFGLTKIEHTCSVVRLLLLLLQTN